MVANPCKRPDGGVGIQETIQLGQRWRGRGGERPHVVVTIPFDPLRRALGVATLDTGENLTPE